MYAHQSVCAHVCVCAHAHARACTHAHVCTRIYFKVQTTSPQTEVGILKKSKSNKKASIFSTAKIAFLQKHVSPSAFLPKNPLFRAFLSKFPYFFNSGRILTRKPRKNPLFDPQKPKISTFLPPKTPKKRPRDPKTLENAFLTLFSSTHTAKSAFSFQAFFLRKRHLENPMNFTPKSAFYCWSERKTIDFDPFFGGFTGTWAH